MNLKSEFEKLGYNKITIHDCIQNFYSQSSENSQRFLIEKPEPQFQLLELSNGFLEIDVNYKYFGPTNIWRISGCLTISYEDIKDYDKTVQTFSNAYNMVHNQTKSLLERINMNLDDNKDCFDFGCGRKIHGKGILFFYSANSYTNPNPDNVIESSALVEEEIAMASLSMGAVFDSFNMVIDGEDSSVVKILHKYMGHKIGYSNDLISKYIDEKVSSRSSVGEDFLEMGLDIMVPDPEENHPYKIQ